MYQALERLPITCRRSQEGFSLLEAMVAAGILSVGLLGLAGLQGMSIGKNVDANEITRVTNLAADMAERIQNNRQRALDYNGIDTSVACAQSASTQAMALGDCTQWRTLLANSALGSVRGIVTAARIDPDPATNPVTMNRIAITIRISWQNGARSETSVSRPKSVTFNSVIAPE
ncbi:MAG: type IV pilus modification protein PilV [Nitrospiraceae bacterium]|nr:type IV pilus modification protein PilV [Nitrospiraceae bacterium]